jgi:hypothetical protein
MRIGSGRRLVCRVGCVASVVHRQRAEASVEERHVVPAVATVVGTLAGVRVGRGEGSFGGAAVERRRMHTSVGHVPGAHGRVRAGTAHARGKSIGTRRTTVLLSRETSRVASRAVRSATRSTTHGGRAHAEARRSVHRRWERRVGNDGRSSTAGAAAQTGSVLREVVVAAAVLTALPVARAERHNAGATAHVAAAHAVAVTTVAHVVLRRTHHAGVGVPASVSSVCHRITARGALGHGRERAAEAGSATLEVGEAAGRAVPVTGARAVLARGERRDDVDSTVEHAPRRRRDLDGLLVQSAAIHAQALRSLELLARAGKFGADTNLFVGGENSEAGTGGLVLVGGAKRPEGDGAAAELREPALELRLGGVVRKTAHVQDFAALREEGANVGAGVHWAGEHVGMVLWRLAFADETSKNASKRDSFFHSPPWRRRG